MAFYELRQYFVRPGKMDGWVKIMEEEIIPFQVSKGMVISGSFHGETDESGYIWLRRFHSEAEREAQYKAVYERITGRPRSHRACRNTWIARRCTSSASFRRRARRCSSPSQFGALRGDTSDQWVILIGPRASCALIRAYECA